MLDVAKATRPSRRLAKIRTALPITLCGVCVMTASSVPSISSARVSGVRPWPTKTTFWSRPVAFSARATPSDAPPML